MKPYIPFHKLPRRDEETGEWVYRGVYYDHYPAEEVEGWEAAYDDYCERKMEEDHIEKNRR